MKFYAIVCVAVLALSSVTGCNHTKQPAVSGLCPISYTVMSDTSGNFTVQIGSEDIKDFSLAAELEAGVSRKSCTAHALCPFVKYVSEYPYKFKMIIKKDCEFVIEPVVTPKSSSIKLDESADRSGQKLYFEDWRKYNNQELVFVGVNKEEPMGYFFKTNEMKVCADGAPNAYHIDNKGLDYLANAGYSKDVNKRKSWWRNVLAVGENGADAHVQQEGRYAGFFVSKTALVDKNKDNREVSKYVDARTVPYLVFPGNFFKIKGSGTLGDFGVAYNYKTKKYAPFIVAEIGPAKANLGEVSIRLAEQLGGVAVNPRNGAGVPSGDTLYIVFPFTHSSPKWPLSEKDITQQVSQYLEVLGGIDNIVKKVPVDD
ncbi:hypothetical protein [Maridesulfovibrio sp. FT414]|uniref:hypothetical protein n=1 Tax=Maridesulfovibrio sp. FT414 TaxID=2979469 RepID=UPI003D8026EC